MNAGVTLCYMLVALIFSTNNLFVIAVIFFLLATAEFLREEVFGFVLPYALVLLLSFMLFKSILITLCVFFFLAIAEVLRNGKRIS